ncbi:DUF1501 domain-containing protein [Myxococcus sp. AM010]|uniref:DUF1501 domain-containing protein n=1 Tax=Myxococcus sp. AM010 TaxID=2745138 RepID=UPI0015953A74|nr:DUF1501 domain-containing protein [Myxococcus sp. AM010]NVJ14871.1 DUF1501 domain-containing protein [Myxococcus sp. AM010]
MTWISRRDLLQALAGAGGLSLLSGCGLRSGKVAPVSGPANASGAPVATPVRPHYIVRISLDGGFDSVMTVDAKDPATAGALDTGYLADERLKGALRLYGPLMGGLLRHDEDLCLVHGVRYNTVAHETGEGILRAGRQRHGASSPPFGDMAAQTLPGGAPIAHLHIQTGPADESAHPLDMLLLPGNPAARVMPPTGGLSIDPVTVAMLVGDERPLFETPAWFDELQSVRIEEARRLLGSRPDELAAHEERLRQAGYLQRLMSSAPRATTLRDSPLGPGLALAFHALRHNHARFITVRSPRVWLDTHTNNIALQSARTRPIFNDIGAFVDMLKREHNAFGPLFEQTTIVIASEMGRFPKLNMAQGKDHWPENSWVLLGRGIRKGVTVGATDERFRGVSVNYLTGSLQGDARRLMEIDALFSTVLHLAGGNPVAQGYERDSVLQCILSSAGDPS